MMGQEITTLEKIKPVGGKRATLALLCSLFALGISAYAVWESKFGGQGAVIAPLVQEAQNTNAANAAEESIRQALQNRLSVQESSLLLFSEDIKKLKTELGQLQQQNIGLASKAAAPTEDHGEAVKGLEQKITELEQKSSVFQLEEQTKLSLMAKFLSAIASIEHMDEGLRQGLGIPDETMPVLEQAAEGNAEATALVQKIKMATKEPLPSDVALREELHAFVPDFLAKEKMAGADNAFKRVLIQLQKLVVIRAKDGKTSGQTPVLEALGSLDEALRTDAWNSGTHIAVGLADKAPKEYAAWLQHYQSRAELAQAVNDLRTMLFNALSHAAQAGAKIEMPKSETDKVQP